MSRTRVDVRVVVTIGFAAAANGDGVAYAAVRGPAGSEAALVRVAFRCRPAPALLGRDVAYAALAAVACDVRRRGLPAVEFRLDDAELCADLAERRTVPAPLVVPYVAVRCALNRFASARVVRSAERSVRDLTARARADVCLNVAA